MEYSGPLPKRERIKKRTKEWLAAWKGEEIGKRKDIVMLQEMHVTMATEAAELNKE